MDPTNSQSDPNSTPTFEPTTSVDPVQSVAPEQPIQPIQPIQSFQPVEPAQPVVPTVQNTTQEQNPLPVVSGQSSVSSQEPFTPTVSVGAPQQFSAPPLPQEPPVGLAEVNPYSATQTIGPLTDVPPPVQQPVPSAFPPVTPNLAGETPNKMSGINIFLLVLAVVLILAMGYVAYVKLTVNTDSTPVLEQIQAVPTDTPIPTVEPTPITVVEPTVMPITDSPDLIPTLPDATPSATP